MRGKHRRRSDLRAEDRATNAAERREADRGQIARRIVEAEALQAEASARISACLEAMAAAGDLDRLRLDDEAEARHASAELKALRSLLVRFGRGLNNDLAHPHKTNDNLIEARVVEIVEELRQEGIIQLGTDTDSGPMKTAAAKKRIDDRLARLQDEASEEI